MFLKISQSVYKFRISWPTRDRFSFFLGPEQFSETKNILTLKKPTNKDRICFKCKRRVAFTPVQVPPSSHFSIASAFHKAWDYPSFPAYLFITATHWFKTWITITLIKFCVWHFSSTKHTQPTTELYEGGGGLLRYTKGKIKSEAGDKTERKIRNSFIMASENCHAYRNWDLRIWQFVLSVFALLNQLIFYGNNNITILI